MKIFLKKKFQFFYENKIFQLYLFYIFVISILSIIFGNQLSSKIENLVDDDYNIILNNIPFYYGPVIENIIDGNGYYHLSYGIQVYMDRFPFIPFFIIVISKISQNIYIFLIIKNIIFFSLLFIFLNNFCKKKTNGYIFFFVILLSVFYNFYNIITLFNFVFADAFIGIFIPSIFLILISDDKNKSLYISSMIFVLFFMKSTMFLVTLLCSIFFIIFEKKIKLSKRCGPLFFVCIAYIIWGTFGYIKTGVFTIGFKTMSSSQLALKTTLNKNFHKYYPKKSVDLIPGKHDANIKYKEEWNNEWDMYNHYKKENVEYINNNKTRILNDTLIKVKFIFFNIHKDAVHPDKNGEFKNPFMFSHLFNRIIFLVSIFFCVISIFKNIIRLNFSKLDYYYIILVGSSILPHLIGWATSKHLVGIFILSHIYLIVKIFEKKLQKYILN